MKNNSNELKKRYYMYNGMINIFVFLNIFTNIKCINLGYIQSVKYYTLCIILNMILISTIICLGTISDNIKTILRSQYSIEVKGTGNFITKEDILSTLYPIVPIIINIVLLFISSLSFKEYLIVSIITFIIPLIITLPINRYYKNIISYNNRENKIKSYLR